MVYDGRREHEHCNDNQHHSTSVQQTGRNVPFETWAAKPTNGKSLDRTRHNGIPSPMTTRAMHLVQTALARALEVEFPTRREIEGPSHILERDGRTGRRVFVSDSVTREYSIPQIYMPPFA